MCFVGCARVHSPVSQLFGMTSPQGSHLREHTLLATELLLFYNIYPAGRRENSKSPKETQERITLLEVRHMKPVFKKKVKMKMNSVSSVL